MTAPWNSDAARAIIAERADMAGPLLPILHALQDHFGHIHAEATPIIADVLNLSRAEVHGVIGFYHDFRKEPPGRHVVKLCRAEACQAAGNAGIVAAAQRLLGIDFGQTTADNRVTLEPVYCLGLCACSPAALIDGRPVGRLTPQRLADELAALA